MAGQTDSADDLIAELARLMAEDAQGDKPQAQPATVRIPGGDSPKVQLTPKPAEVAERPIRIPGQEPARPTVPTPQPPTESRLVPPAAQTAAPAPTPTPFSERRPEPTAQAPVTPRPVPPVASEPKLTAPVAPQAPLPDLDHDSLASIIAAELDTPEVVSVTPNEHEPASSGGGSQESERRVDKFGVPPVFGFGSPTNSEAAPRVAPVFATPSHQATSQSEEPNFSLEEEAAPVAPPLEPIPDPLDEIEKLIGPAVRVQPIKPAPSPALRSLATPTLPPQEKAPSPTPYSAPHVSSVEEAILAAAETSGAHVEWVEPSIAAHLPDDEPVKVSRAPRGRAFGLTRAMAGPLVATLLLGCAAVALYTVLGLGSGTTDGPAPLVVADSGPTKEVPEQAPSTQQDQSVVFNEIEGLDTGAVEQIVSRDQTDLQPVTPAAPVPANEEGLVNRKVRTVTVRPDGTIVSGGDSLAGSAMLPVDRPNVPDVPGADFSTPDMLADRTDVAATGPETSATPPADSAPVVVPVQPGATVPVVDLAGNPVAGKNAPVPLVRPSNFATQARASQPAPVTPAPVTPVAAAAPTASPQVSTTTSSAPAYVQLSSQRTEEAARQTAQQIVSRFGSLFNGANLEVQRVDLGERGIFYRVRVPAVSLQAANTLCASIKANGGDCYTL